MTNINPYINKYETYVVKRQKTFNILSKALFTSYVIIFVWIVIFKCGLVDDLKITHYYISKMTWYERLINISEIESLIYRIRIGEYFHRSILEPFLNIVIFVPLGMYITYFQSRKRIFNTYIISFVISLLIELAQFITMIGGFSYLDLVTNVIGGILGYFACLIIYDKERIYKLNIVSIVFLIIAIPIAAFSIYSTIANISFYIDVILRRL